jgi:hypothetical protein
MAATAIFAVGPPASAQTAAEAAIQDLSERIARVEGREEQAVRTVSGVRMTISGYVKTDFIFDTDQALGDTFKVGAILTDGSGENSRFTAHARQTRLSFQTERHGAGAADHADRARLLRHAWQRDLLQQPPAAAAPRDG